MTAVTARRIRVGETNDKPLTAPIKQVEELPKKQPLDFKDPYYNEILKNYMNLVHDSLSRDKFFYKSESDSPYNLIYNMVENIVLDRLASVTGLRTIPLIIKTIIFASNYSIFGLIGILHGLSLRAYVSYGPHLGGFASAILIIGVGQIFIYMINIVIRTLLFSYNMFTYNPLLN